MLLLIPFQWTHFPPIYRSSLVLYSFSETATYPETSSPDSNGTPNAFFLLLQSFLNHYLKQTTSAP